jgi:hypothetical protein
MRLTFTALTLFAVSLLSAKTYAEEAPSIPKDIRKHLQKLVGQWMLEGNLGDDEIKGKWTAKWGPGRFCLMLNWLPEDSTGKSIAAEQGVAIQGWDPLHKELVESQFRMGGTGTLRLKMTTDGKLKGPWCGVSDGKPAKAEDTFEWIGPDKWKISWKGVENFDDGGFTATRIVKPAKQRAEK